METIVVLIFVVIVIGVLFVIAFNQGLIPLNIFSKEGICTSEIFKLCSQKQQSQLQQKVKECIGSLSQDLQKLCQSCANNGDCTQCCENILVKQTPKSSASSS